MSDHPNAAIARRTLESFNTGDMQAMSEALDDNVARLALNLGHSIGHAVEATAAALAVTGVASFRKRRMDEMGGQQWPADSPPDPPAPPSVGPPNSQYPFNIVSQVSRDAESAERSAASPAGSPRRRRNSPPAGAFRARPYAKR